MKQGIVKFSKEFVTETGLKEWVGIELPFDSENESAVNALRQAETIVREYQRPKSYLLHYESVHPAQHGPDRSDAGEDRGIGLTPELLMSCTDIVTLQTFYPLIFKLTKSDDTLKDAYNKRKAELVAKETKEILDSTNALSGSTGDVLLNERIKRNKKQQ